MRLLLWLLLLVCPAPALAQLASSAAPNITPELVAEGPAPASGGEIELAIVMRPKAGWHGYWLNPGDAGLPMTIRWRLPPGVSVGELRYPVPERLTIAGLMNHVYERDYALLARLKVPPGMRGVLPLRADAEWLACTDKVCVPERGSLSLDLPVGTGMQRRAEFDEWRRALPRPLGAPARFALEGGRLRLALALPRDVALADPHVFAASDGLVDYAAAQTFRRDGDWLIAELETRGSAVPPGRFEGLLAIDKGRGLWFEAASGEVPSGGAPIGTSDWRTLLLALAGAVAGGLLLNVMPCVFPILGVKALSLARVGADERAARAEALGYTAGATLGTAGLGALLLALRAGGSSAGWAFQLQDPRTILLLLLLTTAMTLNLAGAFSLPVLAGGVRPRGSIAAGALAAFVATPCAGPFLGAALGAALLLPAPGALLVFAGLGLGLALPFVAVAFVPWLRSRLPRPGPWMVRFQRLLAIPMAATALACLWLLWRQAGRDGLLLGLAAVAVLSLLLLWFGRARRFGWPVAGAAVALALAVGLLLPAANESPRRIPGAEPWSEQRLAHALARGRPLLVYFTADWCLTCKANEAGAIHREAVRNAFRRHGVEVLAGDWTNGDPAITRLLESRGRAGVPLYLWYEPDGRVEELPQILTPSLLVGLASRPRQP